MVFFHIFSNNTGHCRLLSFGNPSWSGTPFGFSSDIVIPFENEKQTQGKKKNKVSFEFQDKFKVL